MKFKLNNYLFLLGVLIAVLHHHSKNGNELKHVLTDRRISMPTGMCACACACAGARAGACACVLSRYLGP